MEIQTSKENILYLMKGSIVTIMTEMSEAEIARFLMRGTLTGKLATVNKDGSSHVVPIWFVLDDENNKRIVGNIVFTTGESSTKANNISRDKKVSICVDDQTPPFSFVSVFGIAKNLSLQTKGGFEMGY